MAKTEREHVEELIRRGYTEEFAYGLAAIEKDTAGDQRLGFVCTDHFREPPRKRKTMATKTTQGKEQRFLKALMNGKTISRKQATSTYRLGNPSATVARLEQNHGVFISRTEYVSRDGTRGIKYSV